MINVKLANLKEQLMINMTDYQGMIFDFDGTLVDSMGLWHEIDILYLGRRNIDCPPNLSQSIAGMSFSETAEYFKARFDLPDDVNTIQQEWIDMSHDLYLSEIPFKQGALEFIKHLKVQGIPMALATSNNRLTTEAYFKKHRILSYFETLCFTNEVGVGKPDPAVFLKAAEIMNLSPERCLAFEDTPQGLMSAKNAGMTAVCVKDPYQDRQQVLSIADYFTDDYIRFERL